MSKKQEIIIIGLTMLAMLGYLLSANPRMADDGFGYEGFTESLAHGKIDFNSFYGTQGLSILAVPVFWLTGSHISIIITSIILVLLSIPLSYLLGKKFWKSQEGGLYYVALFLLTSFPYVTLMRGFVEATVFFFSILVVYLSLNNSNWTPLVWAFGAIVKPFNLFLFPLFIGNFFNKKRIWFLASGVALGMLYMSVNYYQTGHVLNTAVLTSYSGDYNTSKNPPLFANFTLNPIDTFKNFARIAANFLIDSRKIMIAPIVTLLGVFGLLEGFRNKPETRKFSYAFILVVLFVGSMLYSFPKYLLPAVAISSLFAVGFLMRHKWLMCLVLAGSINTFLGVFNYHGMDFWSKQTFYLPIIFAGIIYLFILYFFKPRSDI